MKEKMRAKMRCDMVMSYADREEVFLIAVNGGEGENVVFSMAIPYGDLKMTIDDSAARGFFQPGNEYYTDFTLA